MRSGRCCGRAGSGSRLGRASSGHPWRPTGTEDQAGQSVATVLPSAGTRCDMYVLDGDEVGFADQLRFGRSARCLRRARMSPG